MNLPTTVPLTIAPEAAARVAELGLQAELGRMLERASQVIPGLTRVNAVVTEPYDTGIEPGIGIEATTDLIWVPGDRTWREWSEWKLSTFPAQVGQYFTLLLQPEAGPGSRPPVSG
jgi:hypothetical protein